MIAVGYCRVSKATAEGLSLEAQSQALRAEAGRRGWELQVVTEAASGRTLGRPLLEETLGRLECGEAQALMATRLDRLSRTVGDFAELMALAERQGWGLVVLDPPVDLTTPFGKAMAHVAAAFAQLERELISQRTREGLAEAKRNGTVLGNPRCRTSEKALGELARCWRQGLSDPRAAEVLNGLGLRSATGGEWTAGKVRWMRKHSPLVKSRVKPASLVEPTEVVERLPEEPRAGSPSLPG